MDVRLARPTDAPLVLSLALDASAHLIKSYGWPAGNPALRSLVRASTRVGMRGRTWIARDGERAALLEAEPRQYVIGWDVTRLAARGDDCDDLIGALVGEATCHLQSLGVPRLFARCEEESCPFLQSLGFQALAREYVLLGPEQHTCRDVPPPMESRYRMPQDDWPLHQLESELTPPLIRQLEGLTSLDWSRPVKGQSELVVEREGKLVAWVGWGSRVSPGIRRVAMLLHSDHLELGPDLLNQAEKHAPEGERLSAWVRDYHVETLRSFQDAGFRIVAEEVLLVKHAGVELAPTQKARMAVAPVPSIQGFHLTLQPPQLVHVINDKEHLCDRIAR